MTAAGDQRPTLRRTLTVIAAVLVGCLIGAAGFGLGYSSMPSYLSSDPQNCANCHVMQSHYDAWEKASHKAVANCDDCHLPHNNLPSQLTVQLQDGLLHGYKFTAGKVPVNIKIRPSSLDVVNSNCVRCHGGMVSNIRTIAGDEDITCTHCHTDIGHI